MARQAFFACVILSMSALLAARGVSAAGTRGHAAPETAASITVPGGTAALADAAGVDSTIPRARILLTVIRVLYELPQGVSPAADARRRRITDYLKQLGESSPSVSVQGGDTVPLPLPEAAWSKLPDADPGGRRGSLLERIVGSRAAALAYYGLCSMDEPTRAFLAGSPEALKVVFTPTRAALLATYGRSLHVSDGRVSVPGGSAAVPLWEHLAGASINPPAAFIAHLFDKDQGRLLLLYDAVAHLEAPAQSFALGLSDPDTEKRPAELRILPHLAHVRALYGASTAAVVAWDPQARPFDRVMFDASQILTQLLFLRNGRPAGPEGRGFWEAAFAGVDVPAQPARLTASAAAKGLVDAPWIIEQISVENTALRRQRAEAFAFVQRVFPTPDAASLPDILVAARGHSRFTMLVLTLERMGIDAPATYAAAVRTADAIARADRSRSWATLTEFQAALAIIERMRFSRTVDVAAADALVRSLCAVPMTPDGEYMGAMGPWLESLTLRFKGPLPQDVGGDRPDRLLETQLLALMAGATTSSPFGNPSRLPTIEWEGLPYRVDPAAATLRRLQDVREIQGGPSLDAALSLASEVRALPGAANPAEAFARIESTAGALLTPQPADAPGTRLGEPNLRALLSTTGTHLRNERRTSNRANLESADDDVLRAAAWYLDIRRATDWYLASVLSAIVYAPLVGARGSQALLGGDPSPLHDLGLAEVEPGTSTLAAWRLPVEERAPTTGWHVRGSLLGLDLALGRFALRRVSNDEVPPAPRITDAERFALTEPVLLLSPFDQSEEGRDALLAALARGRASLADARTSADELRQVAATVGLDEWRMEMLPWMAEHEPDRIPELWSLAELVRLGSADARGTDSFDAFGSSMWSVRGELACRFPWRQPWTTLAGRKGIRVVAGLMPDLTIAVAEALAALKLPARLSAGVLTVATQDLLDTVRMNHADDWLALVDGVQRIAGRPFEDYVAALTYDGPLIPILQEPGHATRQ
jgi:hypothetical protein